ncbi:MAG TPA: SPFH domain-containing protein [Vicinamibacterales bacterium]|nr:SPFH domain-containing protein [Vicinamibacterales bacterium]
MDTQVLDAILSYWWVLPIILALIFWKAAVRLLGIVIVPDDSIGLVTKKFVLFGKHRELPPGKIIALLGEAGVQADTLAPGLKFGYWPWQYQIDITRFLMVPNGQIALVESCDGNPMPDGRILARQVECDNFQDARAFLQNQGERGAQMAVIPPGTWRINTLVFTTHVVAMATVPAGKIGVVEANDGKPLSGGRIIGRHVDCDSFQDAQAFIDNGGERGPQMSIIPQGQYRINPKLFTVTMEDVIDIPDNMIGIVTTKEGQPLTSGEIAGREVPNHDMFQNPQAFVTNGGSKGLQEQVLLAGRYFINPRFATVELIEMTKVPIANVGVVIAYVGGEGIDVTGDAFKHGNLVSRGQKGVWVTPLDPGKYPLNTYTHKVEIVPTANVVLNWATGKTEAHNLDKNLSTITVRSSDGFTFNLDVSQIIHIPRTEAPKVIARFGSMANLVTQVLEPTIGNYFRNAAQNSDVIDFLKQRTARQHEAKTSIAKALEEYNVGAVDTLIGDITPPEALMKTLTDRKIAEQEKTTYNTQKEAEEVRKSLAQARAQADTQPSVVKAERDVEIASFNAQATIRKAEGEAGAKTRNAEADAMVLRTVGAAEGEKITAVGEAEAKVIKQKTAAMDPEKYASVEIARALASSGFKLVPEIVAGGGADGNASGIVNVLLANIVRDSMNGKKNP